MGRRFHCARRLEYFFRQQTLDHLFGRRGGAKPPPIVDLRAARSRLTNYLARPLKAYATDASAAGEAFDASVITSGIETLDQRVAALEQWRQSLPAELDQRENRLRGRMESRTASDLAAMRDSLNDHIDGLRKYVAGDPPAPLWRTYRGPLVLLMGVLVGLWANLASID
jgi:hypothetical protein